MYILHALLKIQPCALFPSICGRLHITIVASLLECCPVEILKLHQILQVKGSVVSPTQRVKVGFF